MAAHDSSWEIFRGELKRWMELRRCTNKGLAEAINRDLAEAGLTSPVDEQIIKRWRHSTSPPLMSLKVIARVLAMSNDDTGQAAYDPTYLPRVMGILDASPENAELIEAAYRLQSIRAKIVEAQNTLATITADEGAVNVVRAAMRSGLGCAVLPAYEGPRGYPMLVSDRIDLREVGPATTAPVVTDHPLLNDALQDAFAVRSRGYPRFSGDHPDTHAGSPAISPWAVQHLARPRTGAVHHPHPGLPAITITSITTTPWPDDVGDIVAMVLGYGFTTTRELARELVSDPYGAEPLRADIHDNFLFTALPSRRVWAHHSASVPAPNQHGPFRDGQGRVGPQLVHIYIAEDDASLRHAAQNPTLHKTQPTPQEAEEAFDTLRSVRAEIDRRFAAEGDDARVYRLEATYFEHPEERWEQAFTLTLHVLRTLAELGVEAQLDEIHARLVRSEPQVAPQVLRWLADHDAPFVSSRYRTMH